MGARPTSTARPRPPVPAGPDDARRDRRAHPRRTKASHGVDLLALRRPTQMMSLPQYNLFPNMTVLVWGEMVNVLLGARRARRPTTRSSSRSSSTGRRPPTHRAPQPVDVPLPADGRLRARAQPGRRRAADRAAGPAPARPDPPRALRARSAGSSTCTATSSATSASMPSLTAIRLPATGSTSNPAPSPRHHHRRTSRGTRPKRTAPRRPRTPRRSRAGRRRTFRVEERAVRADAGGPDRRRTAPAVPGATTPSP